MPETMTKLDSAPDWVNAICHEIDTLVFTSAFDRFSPDAELIFGSELMRGPEEMKKFFYKIDTPLSSKHELFESWSGSGRTYVRGQANLINREKQQFFDPFQWMFYHDPTNEGVLQMWRVTAGPVKTDAVV